LGDKVKIKVKNSDLEKKTIDYALAWCKRKTQKQNG
jgi:hypothetical protein